MKDRIEWLKENRLLVQRVLEHVQNVTQIGLKVTERKNSLVISFPSERIQMYSTGPNRMEVKTGGELLFTQDPDDGMKVRHRMPHMSNVGEIVKPEIIETMAPSNVTEQKIYEQVIFFLERMRTMS